MREGGAVAASSSAVIENEGRGFSALRPLEGSSGVQKDAPPRISAAYARFRLSSVCLISSTQQDPRSWRMLDASFFLYLMHPNQA